MDDRQDADRLEAKLTPWATAADPVLNLVLREMDWYAKRRHRSRLLYQGSELVLLLATAATTLAAALAAPPIVTASLAAVTLFMTGFRQTFDPHARWLACAHAWNQIREAVWQYKLGGPAAGDPAGLLDRIQEISREESGEWLSGQRARRSRPDTGEVVLGDGSPVGDPPTRGRAGSTRRTG